MRLATDSAFSPLLFPHAGVEAIALHEFHVGSFLDQSTFVQHQDSVCTPEGRQSVTHHDFHGGRMFVQGRQNGVFRFRIHSAEAVIEQQDVGLSNEGTCHADALFLTATEVDSPFAKKRVIAVFKLFDVLRDTREARSLRGTERSVFACQTKFDVVQNGIAEQEHVLRDVAHVRSVGGEVPFLEGGAVEQDLALLRVHDAHRQLKHRGFSRTCSAGDAEGFAWSNGKAQVLNGFNSSLWIRP